MITLNYALTRFFQYLGLMGLGVIFLFPNKVSGQHESAIDSSFGQFGWMESRSLDIYKHQGDGFLVGEWGMGLLTFTKFDLQGDTVAEFGVGGQVKVDLLDGLVVRKVDQFSDGYIVMGNIGTDTLATVFLNNEFVVDPTKLSNGWWLGFYPNSTARHQTSENEQTIIAYNTNDGIEVEKRNALGDLIDSFGQNGIAMDRPGWINTVRYLTGDIFYTISSYDPNIGFPNARGDRVVFFDNTGVIKALQFFPEDVGPMIADSSNRWVMASNCDYFDQYKTSRLRYLDDNRNLEDFPANSEAYALHWPDGSVSSTSAIQSMKTNQDGGFLLAGHWFSSAPYDMSIFLKSVNQSGQLNRTFGSQGNLFLKKPEEPVATYDIRKVLQYDDHQLLVSLRMSFTQGRDAENYILKLNTDEILSIIDQERQELEIYPNPTSNGEIKIINAQGRPYKIVNSLGHIIGEGLVGEKAIRMMQSGLYHVQVKVNDRWISRQVLVAIP